ncbi:NAD-dependent epimerase/dehydratase family protein [Desulfovibrio caledoniensis]
MKILVTGATGFIGNHIVKALIRRNLDIVATGRDNDKLASAEWAADVETVPLDITAPPKDLFNKLGSPTHCIHLAWGSLSNFKSDDHATLHLPANLAFLSQLIDGGLKNLLVSGTCFEYGLQEGELTERTPAKPHVAYGIAKNALREELEARSRSFACRLQWARLFYLYGPGQNQRTLFAQLQKAIDGKRDSFDMSGGEQVRDYLHVTEVADALADIALHPTFCGIVNVCSGRNSTLRTLVEEYISERNVSLRLNLGVYPYPDWEPFRFWGAPGVLARIREETRQ